MPRPHVLVLADDCNPEWPSLPVVGYKYARSLTRVADITLVTHIRNKENIEKAGDFDAPITYVDNEWLARPMYKLARMIRRGPEVAWSVQQIMNYLPYLEFERKALSMCRADLKDGRFDIVHRITPMSPTLPSYFAGRTRQPFIIGPLNGNLAWPSAFRAEQAREKERLRILRNAYQYLPFARKTYRKANAILAAFAHTIDDLNYADPAKSSPCPRSALTRMSFMPARARRRFPVQVLTGFSMPGVWSLTRYPKPQSELLQLPRPWRRTRCP